MTREHRFSRETKETKISGEIKLEGTGVRKIDTGIGFLDHMLDLFAFHGGFDLNLTCNGDLDVCPHHSIEDIAISLGQAYLKALGDRRGIHRYATCYLPMDETLSRTVIDISGRGYHVFQAKFRSPAVGAFPMEMVGHFFFSFAMNAGITLHQEVLYGENDHHQVESLFKGLGRALRDASALSQGADQIPSTKGVL